MASPADLSTGKAEDPVLPAWFPGPRAFLAWAILSVALIKPSLPLEDQGTGRHLATGQAILDAGRLPATDPLGFLYTDRPYLDFEWLFDILSRLCANTFGLSALSLAAFGLFALTILILLKHLLENGISLPVALAGGLLACTANYVHLLARPVILTYFFLAATVLLWRRILQKGPVPTQWAMLPSVFLVWANTHPGFVSGLVFMGLSLAGAFWDERKEKPQRHRQAAALLAACGLATLANPYGPKLHALIFHQVFHSKSLAYVQEFLPPDFSRPNGAVLALGVVLASGFILGLRHQGRLRASDVLPALFFLFFALRAQRHILLFIPVVLFPLMAAWDAWLLSSLPAFLRERVAAHTRLALQARHDWAWGLAGFAAISLLFHLAFSRQLRVGGNSLGPAAETFIESHLGQFQRPFTSTIQAGNLLFYFHPRLKISFDDRVDFYQDTESFAHVRAINLQGDWRGFLEQHRFDSALLAPSDPLAEALRHEPGWSKLYADPGLVIFKKSPSQGRW
jgi:hypothetical protein